jgi:hypothetical protein
LILEFPQGMDLNQTFCEAKVVRSSKALAGAEARSEKACRSNHPAVRAKLTKYHICGIFCFMSEVCERLPDNSWFDGQVASWESSRYGYRALFEAIVDPPTFKEVCASAGDDELIELFEPKEGDVLALTMLDQDNNPTGESVILTSEHPATIVEEGSRFILDATASTDPFAYTCTIYGEKPIRQRMLTSFFYEGEDRPVSFVETVAVREGVRCDVYQFDGDDTRDLAVIAVDKGVSTPLRKVIDGTKTTEGYIWGKAKLTITRAAGNTEEWSFPGWQPVGRTTDVYVGDTMQWKAKENLTFYEICEPPYQDGRFLDLD